MNNNSYQTMDEKLQPDFTTDETGLLHLNFDLEREHDFNLFRFYPELILKAGVDSDVDCFLVNGKSTNLDQIPFSESFRLATRYSQIFSRQGKLAFVFNEGVFSYNFDLFLKNRTAYVKVFYNDDDANEWLLKEAK
jgi:hypothetical protein